MVASCIAWRQRKSGCCTTWCFAWETYYFHHLSDTDSVGFQEARAQQEVEHSHSYSRVTNPHQETVKHDNTDILWPFRLWWALEDCLLEWVAFQYFVIWTTVYPNIQANHYHHHHHLHHHTSFYHPCQLDHYLVLAALFCHLHHHLFYHHLMMVMHTERESSKQIGLTCPKNIISLAQTSQNKQNEAFFCTYSSIVFFFVWVLINRFFIEFFKSFFFFFIFIVLITF